MRIEKFHCPAGTEQSDCRLRDAWVKAMVMSDETGFVVRVVIAESDEVQGFALFCESSLVVALALEDAIDDLWCLFDAMHAYFEIVEPGEA